MFYLEHRHLFKLLKQSNLSLAQNCVDRRWAALFSAKVPHGETVPMRHIDASGA